MGWARNSSRKRVQIDTDWLLGPAPSSKSQSPQSQATPSARFSFRRAVPFLSLIGVVTAVGWNWERASQDWLEWQIAQEWPVQTVADGWNPPLQAVATSPAIEVARKPMLPELAHDVPVTALPIAAPEPSPIPQASIPSHELANWEPEASSDPHPNIPLPAESPENFGATTRFTVELGGEAMGLAQAPSESKVPAVAVTTISRQPERVNPLREETAAVRTADKSDAVRGLNKLSTEKLIRLLESSQDRLVAQAVEALESRGMEPDHVELALEMARGDTRQRLHAMEQLARDPKIQPVPWLVWMAESSDREVRMRAIAMLGATADEEALRKLRILKQREIDTRVAEQITQVLLTAGSARSNKR